MRWFTRAACIAGIMLTPQLWSQNNPGAISGGPIMTPYNTPAANVPVFVCPITAVGTPCNTAGVTLYSDYTLTRQISNPTSTNMAGLYSFFVASPYTYLVQIQVTTTTTYTYYVTGNAGGTGCTVAANPFSVLFANSVPNGCNNDATISVNPNTHTFTAPNINMNAYVSGLVDKLPGGAQTAGTAQNAISTLGIGGHLILSSGYSETLPATLTLPAGFFLECDPGVMLTTGGNFNAITIASSGVRVKGCGVNGNALTTATITNVAIASGTATVTLSATRPANYAVGSLVIPTGTGISGFDNSILTIASIGSNSFTATTTATGSASAGTTTGGYSGEGVELNGATHFELDGLQISGTGSHGVHLSGSSYGTLHDLDIEPLLSGTSIFGENGTHDVSVTTSTINRAGMLTLNHCIAFHSTTALTRVYNITVSNNKETNGPAYCNEFGNFGGANANNIVNSSNVIYQASVYTGAPFGCISYAGVDTGSIASNTCFNLTGARNNTGIEVADSTRVNETGNLVWGNVANFNNVSHSNFSGNIVHVLYPVTSGTQTDYAFKIGGSNTGINNSYDTVDGNQFYRTPIATANISSITANGSTATITTTYALPSRMTAPQNIYITGTGISGIDGNTFALTTASGTTATFATTASGTATAGWLAVAWTASTFYSPGDAIVDSNGNVEVASTDCSNSACESGTTQPTWPTLPSGQGVYTADSSGQWQIVGAPPATAEAYNCIIIQINGAGGDASHNTIARNVCQDNGTATGFAVNLSYPGSGQTVGDTTITGNSFPGWAHDYSIGSNFGTTYVYANDEGAGAVSGLPTNVSYCSLQSTVQGTCSSAPVTFNYVTDSTMSYQTAWWTLPSGMSFTGSLGSPSLLSATGTGSAFGTMFSVGQPITVPNNATVSYSGLVNAANATAGTPALLLCANSSCSTQLSHANQTAGVAGTVSNSYTNLTGSAVTAYPVLALSGVTVTSAQPITLGDFQFNFGPVAFAYYPTVNLPPNTPVVGTNSQGALAPGSLSSTPPAGDAGMLYLPGNTGNQVCPTNDFCLGGFSSASATAYGIQPPNTPPSGTQIMVFPTPTSGWSQGVWTNLPSAANSVPRPNLRSWCKSQANHTATFQSNCDNLTLTGTASAVTYAASGSYGEFETVSYLSASSSAANAGVTGLIPVNPISTPIFQAWVVPTTYSAERIWIALGNPTFVSAAGASDTPSGDYADFRASTVAGDTDWECVSSNGTQNVISSGVAVTAGVGHTFEVDITTAGYTWFIGGTQVCNSTSGPIGSTVQLEQYAQATTTTTTAATLGIAHTYLEYQPPQ